MKQYRNSLPIISKNLQETFPFEIRTIQSDDELANNTQVAHSHDYFEMIWVVKGKGTFLLDLQKCAFENNRLFCVKPNQVHQLLLDDDAHGFIISFSDAFLSIGEQEFDWNRPSAIFQLFARSEGISFQHDAMNDMEELAGKMVKEYDNQYAFKIQVLRRLLKIFLIYLARELEDNYRPVTQTRDMELVQNFMNLLEQNFKQKKMVAEYAQQLFVTPNYLNEVVKKNTGYSAGRHIRQRVVLEAKRLGRHSDICMKEIAYSLGFLDSAHFSKFFKTVTGTNFSDFKKEGLQISTRELQLA